MTCVTCHGVIFFGQPAKVFFDDGNDEPNYRHVNAADCVAATARRCAEIAWENEPEGEEFGSAAIRREFPAAFVRVEEGR